MKSNIIEVVQNIERSINWPPLDQVFRGEPACFEKVSSGLYRTYGLEKDEQGFSIKNIESEMVEKARSFTDMNDSFDILCEIQHRGGKTNRIDFTRDLGVALFFACGTTAGMEQEPGRVIMLDDSQATRKAGVEIKDVTHPIHMAAAQKSVFVSTDSGYLDDQHLPHVKIWTIDADEKYEILQYLKKSRGIDSRSIFMDISGFIRHAHEFENANARYYRTAKMFVDGDFDGVIEESSKYLRISGSSSEPYQWLYLRGQSFFKKGDEESAFPDLRRTLGFKYSKTGRPAYELPARIRQKLDQWCKEQERIEEENSRRSQSLQEPRSDAPILTCIVSATAELGLEKPAYLKYFLLTDTGYSYGQSVEMGSEVRLTLPSPFLEFEASCWWSFHGDEYQYTTVPRKSVREDFHAVIPSKPRSSMTECSVRVRFVSYDAQKHELKRSPSGKFQLVPLA